MFTITIPTKLLEAALLFSPKSDVRYYLNGVFFDAKASVIVSTGGAVLFVSAPSLVTATENSRDVIMPHGFISDVVRFAKAAKLKDVDISVADDKVLSYLSAMASETDARYPDWRRIYPQTRSLVSKGAFNIEQLGTVAKANKILGSKNPGVFPIWYGETENDCAACDVQGQAHVIVMPVRVKNPPSFVRFAI